MTGSGAQATSPGSAAPPHASGDDAAAAAMRRFPILVGISGKRMLDQDVTIDRAREPELAARFRALFAALDAALPDTPKVLLTGAAFGADLIAAEAALQAGDNWAVAAVLPFGRALFAEDFDPTLDEKLPPGWPERILEYAQRFDRLMDSAQAANPRVLVRELPILAADRQSVATAERLSRASARYNRAYRRNHYEQVGQYIAEAATIMIAVMSDDEQADKTEANGGTARVVAYRRAGRPDGVGAAVARRSTMLRREWTEVIPPPAAHVWLVDPRREDDTDGYPVKVLPPLADRLVEEVYAGFPGRDMAPERESYVGPLRAMSKAWRTTLAGPAAAAAGVAKRAGARQLRASLPAARGINRYNKAKWKDTGGAAVAVVADLSEVANVPDALNAERVQISALQRTGNEHAKLSFWLLAGLFVVAVLVFEIFAKFLHDSWIVLAIYLVVLAAIGLLVFLESWNLAQAVAEDYRAVAEMLRVQRAWSAAGLDARVDREHLQGVDHDLAPIRDCAKTIIAWILLRHGWSGSASARDWAHVRGTVPRFREELRGAPNPPADWIGSQLWYFIKNGEAREAGAAWIDAVSWCLFITSALLGAVLLTWLKFGDSLFQHWAHIRLLDWRPMLRFDASFVLWAALAALAIWFRGLNHDFRQGLRATILTAVCGTIAALMLALAFIDVEPLVSALVRRLAPWLGAKSEPPDQHQALTNVVISALVVLYAGAGAMRYLMERLNIEAEALEYRDARARFELAERRLAPGSDPVSGAPADEDAAQRLVYELGRLALAENEAWLKSRRERPLTPIVG
jgi:hypothetical protein